MMANKYCWINWVGGILLIMVGFNLPEELDIFFGILGGISIGFALCSNMMDLYNKYNKKKHQKTTLHATQNN